MKIPVVNNINALPAWSVRWCSACVCAYADCEKWLSKYPWMMDLPMAYILSTSTLVVGGDYRREKMLNTARVALEVEP